MRHLHALEPKIHPLPGTLGGSPTPSLSFDGQISPSAGATGLYLSGRVQRYEKCLEAGYCIKRGNLVL